MILIGEKLNSARAAVREALARRDEDFVRREAKAQAEAGAAYVDVNAAALMQDEIPALSWAVPIAQGAAGVPLSIDSPNTAALEAGLRAHSGPAFLNSITAEGGRLRDTLPIVRDFKPRVAALCLGDGGLPRSADEVLANAGRLVDALQGAGVAPGDIFLDPLVRPVGAEPEACRVFLDALGKIKARFPGVKTIAGISNVSFGMPERRLLNRTLFVLAAGRGLDAAVCDPTDPGIVAALAASDALLGREGALKDYLKYARGRAGS